MGRTVVRYTSPLKLFSRIGGKSAAHRLLCIMAELSFPLFTVGSTRT